METIQAYGCSYCGMVSRRKDSVKRHEAQSCRKNDKRIRCNNCDNYSYDDLDGPECLAEMRVFFSNCSNETIVCEKHIFIK